MADERRVYARRLPAYRVGSATGSGSRSWALPERVDSDALVDWACANARALVPSLSADAHTVVHAVAGALADDLLAHGAAPATLRLERAQDTLSLSVQDARDYLLRVTRPLPEDVEEIRPLTTGLRVHRVPGQRGCTLTATIAVCRAPRRPWRLRPSRRTR